MSTTSEPRDVSAPARSTNRAARGELAAALIALLLGAGTALLLAGRAWQTVRAVRPLPLPVDVLGVSGRTLEPAITALGLVGLAGVVAVLATRGLARRVVGGLLALAGAVIIWRAAAGLAAVTSAHARNLVSDAHTGVGIDATTRVEVNVHAVWPVLSIVCGILVAAAGILVAMRGATWTALSMRYEAPTAAARAERAPTEASLWNALDRGDDPTAR